MNFQLIKTIYALNPIIGSIDNPTKYGVGTNNGEGLFRLLNNLFQLAGLIAGLFVIFQIISAGYMYLSASGDPKKFEQAWNYFAFQIIMAGYAMLSSEGDAKKIEQSRDRLIEACLGLFVVVIAIIIASLFATLLGISDPLNIDLLVRNLKF